MAYLANAEFFYASKEELFPKFPESKLIFFILLNEECLRTVDDEIKDFSEELPKETPALMSAHRNEKYDQLKHFYEQTKQDLHVSNENFIKANEVIASYYGLQPTDLPVIIISHKECDEKIIVHKKSLNNLKFNDFKGVAKTVLKFSKYYKKMIKKRGSENLSGKDKLDLLRQRINFELFHTSEWKRKINKGGGSYDLRNEAFKSIFGSLYESLVRHSEDDSFDKLKDRFSIPSEELPGLYKHDELRNRIHQALVSYFGLQESPKELNEEIFQQGMHKFHYKSLCESVSTLRKIYQDADPFTLSSCIAIPKIVEKEILTSLLQVIRRERGIDIDNRFLYYDESIQLRDAELRKRPFGINQRGRKDSNNQQLNHLNFPPVSHAVSSFRRQFDNSDLYPYPVSESFFQIRNQKQAHLNNYDPSDRFVPHEFFEDQFEQAFRIIKGCIKVREKYSLTDIYKHQIFNNPFEITPEPTDG